MKNIPAKIHLIYLSQDEPYPETFIKCISRIKTLHPNWEINIYNDDDASRIINDHLPYLNAIFNSYEHFVQRADIFRVVLVYLFGGFYLDMDMFCLKPLDDLQRFHMVLAEEKTLKRAVKKTLRLNEKIRVANYMFGSIAKHPFWLDFLKESLLKSLEPIIRENDILDTTGPGLLSSLFSRKRFEYTDITLIPNADRICLVPGHNQVSCYFGNYAAHLHQGSWRWGDHTLEIKTKSISLKEEKNKAIKMIEKDCKARDQGSFRLNITKSFIRDKNLDVLYQLIKRLENFKFNKRINIICGSPLVGTEPLSFENVNILYSSIQENHLPKSWVSAINSQYRCVVVPGDNIKRIFLASGIRAPIFSIHPSFYRHKRNLYEDFEEEVFNLSFTIDNSSFSYFKMVLEVFCRIQKQIPELRLKVYIEMEVSDFEDIIAANEKDGVNYYRGFTSSSQFSDWYKEIHCNIYIANDQAFPFNPLESLYLGIPTLINNTSSNDDLKKSGYFAVIDLECKDNLSESPSDRDFNTILEAILDIHSKYSANYQLATKGAFWLEDKWLQIDTEQEMLTILNAMDNS